jgi:hypothetical protein
MTAESKLPCPICGVVDGPNSGHSHITVPLPLDFPPDATSRIAALEVQKAELVAENAAIRRQLDYGMITLQIERDAYRTRAEAAEKVVALVREWWKREDDGPQYPLGESRDTPGNEAIWREWYDGNQDLCSQVRAALAQQPPGGEG